MVEDERRLARFIRRALAEEGFEVNLCRDGNEALDLIQSTSFDAIVLDVMLPGRDGLSVLKKLRSRSISTPVLLLTGRGSINERVEGLNLGADDYVSKPFSTASCSVSPCSAAYLRTSSVIFMLHPPSPRLRCDREMRGLMLSNKSRHPLR